MKKNTPSKTSLLSQWRNKNKQSSNSKKGIITEIPKGAITPLSTEQKRLWFLQQLNPNNPFYNYSEIYTLKGKLDVDIFERSIRLIENNHDVFKSIFEINNGEPILKIDPNIKSDFKFIDFSKLDITTAKNKTVKIFKEESSTSFNLSKGNLFKIILVKTSENDYSFLIIMHHIITDHQSMIILREELASNYAQLISGKKISIIKPTIQYGSYAYWQQNKSINIEHLNYWKSKLGGQLEILNLPTDFSKKAIPTYKGALHLKKHSAKNGEAFFNLCKELEATHYVVMLSVFYILLNKYTEQEDILIGTSITKRTHKSLEKLIGFFNDTLVFRTSIKKEFNFKEIVQAVKKTTLEAFEHSDISFDHLVKELNPNRSLNTNPFFQVMFLYNTNKDLSDFGSDIKISHEAFDAGVSKFDLTLHINENQGSLESLLDYNTDLFKGETIARIHDHFEVLLQTVLNNPEIIVGNIKIDTDQEKAYFDNLQCPQSFFKEQTRGIHNIIEQEISKNALSTAVSFKNEKVSYEQLGLKSDIIANYLIHKGIQKNDIVSFSLERSSEMIFALFGILKAGAAYLPLDPKYPENRTNYILSDSTSKFVLTSNKLKANFNKATTAIFTIESIFSENLEIEKTLFPKVQGTDLAYVIYTSGSTGKPKGVPITHNNIINSTLARTSFYKKDPAAFLMMSSISFDSSKAGIFWSLCTGGNLVISENKLEQDIELLVSTIKNNNISHTLMLPSLYNTILDFADTTDLKSLKVVSVAGETCSTKTVDQHFKKLPNTCLYNEYGPTEGTVWSVAHKIKKSDIEKETIPIGIPVANTEIYILNQKKQRVPFGVPGELYIGGPSLANGYLNKPQKTAESFITNPFKHSQKIYKTGDIVKLKNDNTIEFLGRKDQQVKIRGYRIEIDEIEHIINDNPMVDKALVIVEDMNTNIDLNNLVDQDTEQLLQKIKNYTTINEIEELLNTVESLNEDEVSVLSENLGI